MYVNTKEDIHMSVRLVLADFDGTLCDSMPFWARLPGSTLTRAGIELPADLDELIRSRPMWEISYLFVERYPQLGERDALYKGWMDEMAENYRCRIPMKEGAMELLAALQAAQIPTAILSATNHGLLDRAVAGYGLLPYLTDVITEGDVGASKRTPKPFEFCMERFGVRAEEILLLEDSCPNICCAAELGIHTCAIYDESMAGSWDVLQKRATLALNSFKEWPRVMELIR